MLMCDLTAGGTCRKYYTMGLWVARHPGTVLLLAFVFVAGFSAGLIKFQVETDPVALWSVERRYKGSGTISHPHRPPVRAPNPTQLPSQPTTPTHSFISRTQLLF